MADVETEKGDLSEITGLDLVGQTMSEATMRYWQLSEANLRMARTLKRAAKKADEKESVELQDEAKLLERDAIVIIRDYVEKFLRQPQKKEISDHKVNHANLVKEQDETQRQKYLQRKKDEAEKAAELKKNSVAEISVVVQ